MANKFTTVMGRSTGLSLAELLVSTAILAVLIQIAVPQCVQLLATWQRDLATRSMTDHLVLARSEAIRWSQRVVMCSSQDGKNCAPRTEKDWKSGWLVFQDLDSDGQFGDLDKLIATSQGPVGIKSLRGNAQIQRFIFLPTGMMASGMATLQVSPRLGNTQNITVNRIGRVRLSLTNTSDEN